MSLGAWSEPGLDAREVYRLQRERERRQAALAEKEEAERRQRMEARDHLLGLHEVYRLVNSRLTPDMEAAEQELYYEFLSDLTDEIREADAGYCELVGLEYQ